MLYDRPPLNMTIPMAIPLLCPVKTGFATNLFARVDVHVFALVVFGFVLVVLFAPGETAFHQPNFEKMPSTFLSLLNAVRAPTFLDSVTTCFPMLSTVFPADVGGHGRWRSMPNGAETVLQMEVVCQVSRVMTDSG